ncbi:GTP pyrophosphokinase [Sporobacter termitidis DSM 10068]|uniref:GTP diphosphokinase n=1 Tax=Sporobacter termitidis DSM 10068 TaxID=1123282 RepID=A0A1M5Z5D7_9FIRM|nr:bifunctional (p)ppGpp synthetase/guanosine-3',5'-bis(diphosphate) 3'-pyrophosphohydrolase [Sporobacter termitidis]SHI19093.1 GTP pyrophosphokinase [Sporobacter termitidis DSM 10068]
MEELMKKYAHFEAVIKENNPTADLSRIRTAFDFAANAHENQRRKDGSLYVTHPLASAEIIAEMGLDEEAIIAALLHDVIEDTGVTHEEIAKRFGSNVADIVEGVTKLSRVMYTSKEEEQMENLRKMLLAMAKDIRVILIKMADRLHNMRTMEYQTPRKQSEKALETMEIYAPLAHRLGMQKIKWELEDLSIYYLDPIGYAEIEDGLKKILSSNDTFIDTIQNKISERLHDNGINCDVYGRVKHIYSIYRKMYSQNKTLSEVLDLYAFRVIVNDIADCYNVLGYIHEMFRPIPGHFKDYIGTPKPNMYQSLHTTVIGTEGIPFEVQIRTWEMHHTAEYGIAAHWKYKEGISGKFADEEKFAWVRRLLESQQDSDAQDFFQDLKIDMFSDEVFVFTPRGDVINLPAGATPIDFAYNIHSAVGNRMTGAIVNGRIVPFNHELQNGDIVEVLTSNSSKGPSRDWLNIVKSPEARNKIRQWFKKEKREENITAGKLAFEAELRRVLLSMSDLTREDILPRLLKRLAFPTLEELYAAIGYGGMSAQKAVNRIRDELRTIDRVKKTEVTPFEVRPDKKLKPIHGILVEGVDNVLIKFARCCTPVPGDESIGFITRGFGVSVHRQDCKNYLKSAENPEEAGRWVRVAWANTDDDIYSTALFITARERSGIVVDVATILNGLKIKMTSMSAKDQGDTTAISIVIEVKNRDDLNVAMARLAAVPGVLEIRRGDG